MAASTHRNRLGPHPAPGQGTAIRAALGRCWWWRAAPLPGARPRWPWRVPCAPGPASSRWPAWNRCWRRSLPACRVLPLPLPCGCGGRHLAPQPPEHHPPESHHPAAGPRPGLHGPVHGPGRRDTGAGGKTAAWLWRQRGAGRRRPERRCTITSVFWNGAPSDGRTDPDASPRGNVPAHGAFHFRPCGGPGRRCLPLCPGVERRGGAERGGDGSRRAGWPLLRQHHGQSGPFPGRQRGRSGRDDGGPAGLRSARLRSRRLCGLPPRSGCRPSAALRGEYGMLPQDLFAQLGRLFAEHHR